MVRDLRSVRQTPYLFHDFKREMHIIIFYFEYSYIMASPSRKQNRCVEHAQEIVALCIQEDCDQKVKAVCPLELYNDHLDHKFENIAKIHSDWGLYEKDAREVEQNISREAVMKYMDGIIDELMFKIKEHLFLVRK